MTMAMEPPTWSVVDAAPLLSGLSGLVAGFAFTGVTLVLTRPTADRTDETSATLARHSIGELLLASLVMGVAALEWALVSGEKDPLLVRPAAAAVFAGVTLLIGSMQVVAGLCYLVIDFERKDLPSTGSMALTLTSLCTLGYFTYAVLTAFYVTWVTADVLWLGLVGWPRPQALWFGQVAPLAAAATVAMGLAPLCSDRVLWPASPLRTASQRATQWFSAWHGAGLVAILAASGFVTTVFLASDDSSLARPGGWDLSPAVLLYVLVLVAVEAAAIAVLILQGRIIHGYCRSTASPPAAAADP
jgi:hypothetical protein